MKTSRSAWREGMAEITADQPWWMRALAYPLVVLWLAIYLLAEHPSHEHDSDPE